MSLLSMHVQLRKLVDFSGKFRKLLDAELNQAIRDTANTIRNEARRLAPKDTGKLKRGYRTSLNKRRLRGSVRSSSSIPYPVNVEYGTSRTPAQPHLGPAGKSQAQAFEQRVKDAMRKAVS